MGMQSRRQIIIAGGNFAGLTVARGLCNRRFQVTVVDPGNDFEWYPNIHELVSRQKKPSQLRHSRRQILERLGHTFVNSAVTAIDRAQKRVITDDGRSLPYDDLVLAIGNTGNIDRVPGANRFALACAGIEDAERIAQQLQRLDALSLPSRPVILAGANFVGLELLGEIIRRFRRQWRFSMHVVDAQAGMMPAYAGLDGWLREQCDGLDIHWHFGRKVIEVEREAIVLDDDTRLESRLTLWCAGDVPSSLPSTAGLAQQGRYPQVGPTLQSVVDDRIWIAGDAAGFPVPLDKQAFHAIAMGNRIASNLRRLAQNHPLREYRPLAMPRLMSFGDTGLMLLPSMALAHPGFLAAKEAVYQGNFARFNLPRETGDWLELGDQLIDGAKGMLKLARNSWESDTWKDAKRFNAA
ncbi:MAG TPA: FAD-dependent oxidoreductase [Fluviicoccus sp.]|nr:FAD-dependent oxidoreductase [Fluviicoccus sp.]